MEFSIVATIVCSLFIVLFVLNSNKVDERKVLLATLYILIINVSLNHYATVGRIDWLYLSTNALSTGAGYLVGSICYLFITAHFEKPGFKRTFINLIPFLAFLLLIGIPLTLSNPTDGYFFDYLVYVGDYGEEFYVLELVFFFAFTRKAHIKYKVHGTTLNENGTAEIKQQLSWIEQLIYGIYVFIAVDFSTSLYVILSGDAGFPDLYVSALLMGFITFYISYHGLYKSKIFAPIAAENGTPESNIEGNASSPLSLDLAPNEAKALEKKLLFLLEEEKLFLDPSLTLAGLASKMGMTEKKLSAFINNQLNTGFYELINHHRLEEFLKQMENPENEMFSLMAIANQSGFKSKTSFYAYFKKQKGMTPAAYHKKTKLS